MKSKIGSRRTDVTDVHRSQLEIDLFLQLGFHLQQEKFQNTVNQPDQELSPNKQKMSDFPSLVFRFGQSKSQTVCSIFYCKRVLATRRDNELILSYKKVNTEIKQLTAQSHFEKF